MQSTEGRWQLLHRAKDVSNSRYLVCRCLVFITVLLVISDDVNSISITSTDVTMESTSLAWILLYTHRHAVNIIIITTISCSATKHVNQENNATCDY